MASFAFVCTLYVLLNVVLAAPRNATNFYAARCCSLGPRCEAGDAEKSNLCKPGLWMTGQSQECQDAACRYCKLNVTRRQLRVCSSPPIQKQCFDRSWPFTTPTPVLEPTAPPRPPTNSGRCSAPGVVVIPASKFPAPAGWVRTPDRSGLTWKPSSGAGIDPPGSGAFCINSTPNRSGLQYFTVLSSAPHPTEHNDAWFRFVGGVILSRHKSIFTKPGSEWLKGYENLGKNEIADYIVHKDFDGHQFIMTSKRAGQKATVCVAGRSSKYTIYELVLISCPPGSDKDVSKCSRFSPYISNIMRNLPKCNSAT